MKKAIVAAGVIMSMVVLGSAVCAAEDGTGSGQGRALYNGITYFDQAVQPYASAPVQAADAGSYKKPFNGITVFDIGEPRPAKEVDSRVASAKLYNGITVF